MTDDRPEKLDLRSHDVAADRAPCRSWCCGMVIVSNYTVVRPREAELIESEFGCSTMNDPTDPYQREGCLAMLRDWGWPGSSEDSPSWPMASEGCLLTRR